MGKVAEVLDAAKRAACETCLARTESGEENVLRQAKAKLARERERETQCCGNDNSIMDSVLANTSYLAIHFHL